ncbi:hypothetical protein LZ30DRAFT_341313 [Colletotrichum cereale]|nr:hypothetical protein LZ30DRAFT_341313 [Colletotrichum cereale]
MPVECSRQSTSPSNDSLLWHRQTNQHSSTPEASINGYGLHSFVGAPIHRSAATNWQCLSPWRDIGPLPRSLPYTNIRSAPKKGTVIAAINVDHSGPCIVEQCRPRAHEMGTSPSLCRGTPSTKLGPKRVAPHCGQGEQHAWREKRRDGGGAPSQTPRGKGGSRLPARGSLSL